MARRDPLQLTLAQLNVAINACEAMLAGDGEGDAVGTDLNVLARASEKLKRQRTEILKGMR